MKRYGGLDSALDKHLRNLISKFFSAFDELKCPYCVLHGYSSFVDIVGNDIDILVQKNQTIDAIDEAVRLGAELANLSILRRSRYFYTLITCDQNTHPLIFSLDFLKSASLPGFDYCNEQELLANRHKQDGIWTPNPGQAYACYFIRCLIKANLNQRKKDQITVLYREVHKDGLNSLLNTGVPRKIATTMDRIVQTQNWDDMEMHLARFSEQLKRCFEDKRIENKLRNTLDDWINRMDRLVHPGGLSVVMLGQDGAGKSTTIDTLENSDELPFDRIIVWGFAPAMHRLVKKGPIRTDTPHALPPRSTMASLVKGVYWLLHALLGHIKLRVEKSRNTLVLYDRHFIDVAVDPIRYRYGGPMWMLQLVAKLTPTPDLILLLDAPPDVLHERKPELELPERHRQSKKYLELVSGLPNSVIIDASKNQHFVLQAVQKAILRRLGECKS